MAKIICAYSSVEFHCEHLPLAITSREVTHPLFHVSRKKLVGLTGQWISGRLSPTESYLLYLSLLHSTDLIEWRVPAMYHAGTAQIVANNMEQLLSIIGRIDAITHPSFILPHFVISPDTCSLENSYHWIQIWTQNYNDWRDNIKSHANDQELTRRENSLNKLIKTSHKRIEDYPSMLAKWAVIAGDFPTFSVRVSGVKQTLSDYWYDIILKCARAESIFMVPAGDLNELVEHCIDNIAEEGSLYSNALMKYLRRGQEMQKNYLDLGDIDLASRPSGLTAFTILSASDTAERVNIQNMIDLAPAKKPDKKDYPDLLSFLKAQGRWLMKESYVSVPSPSPSPSPSPKEPL